MVPRLHVEIADFPRRVLRHHWPTIPLLSDLVAVSGGRKMRAYMRALYRGIDLLAGGTPCQDLSIAGRRAGITGVRSSLYFRFVRLWKVLECPYILWENVDGALSSNAGADFALVLSAIVGATVAVPSDGWRGGGVVAGPTGVAAWRLLDAQYFGVPQRRRRVFVLGARAGGCDPAEILLELSGVCGNPPTRSKPGQRIADSLTVGANQTCGFPGDVVAGGCEADYIAFHLKQNVVNGPVVPSLGTTTDGMGVLAFSAKDSGGDAAYELAPTLRAGTHDASHENGGVMPAVIAFDTTQITSADNRCNPRAGDPCHPLAAGAHVPLLVSAFNETGHEKWRSEEIAGSLNAHEAKEPHTLIAVVDIADETIVGALCATHVRKPGAREAAAGHVQVSGAVPRRLMPIECERLMGWPDNWTNVPDAKGKPASDSARYKACGNGVVSSQVEWIAARLLAVRTAMSDDHHSLTKRDHEKH